MLLFGSPQALANAFAGAGWMPAEKLDIKTDAMTFFAIAAHHSYHEGPVSSLVVGGEKPSFVFEKTANTFAKRHHIRIWRQQMTWGGAPVWIGAGTHDIGIDFSKKERTFSHSVEANIDDERQKIEDDLIFGGGVKAASLMQRPSAPRSFRNATGDQLQSDGAVAVMQLGSTAH